MKATATRPTPTKQSILLHLRQQGRASAQELASHLQISPQAIRRHLHDLEQEGLVLYEVVSGGMGRPQHSYRLSPSGQERFPASYDEFALGLLTTLAETVSPEQMGSILRQQWQRKAQDYRRQLGDRSLQEQVANLVELRRAEGYMAEYRPYGDGADGRQFVLLEHNCAIAQVAQSFPSVCGHELEMFAAALPHCSVERINWLAEGKSHCGYLISTR